VELSRRRETGAAERERAHAGFYAEDRPDSAGRLQRCVSPLLRYTDVMMMIEDTETDRYLRYFSLGN
jgi:hypothetical protein